MALRSALWLSALGAAVADILREPPVPRGWQPSAARGVSLEKDQVTLRFVLKQTNRAEVYDLVAKVSNPQNPTSYGKYLTFEEARNFTAPAEGSLAAVEAWLVGSGVAFRRAGAGVLEATMPVNSAEKLLKTSFRTLASSETGAEVQRAGDVTIPADVARALDAVTGLYGLPAPQYPAPRRRPGGRGLGAAAREVTPPVLWETYGVPAELIAAHRGTSEKQAVASFQKQTMNTSDLEMFFERYVPNASAADDEVHKFVGDPALGKGQGEASLDIQYIMGTAPGVKTEFWYFSGDDFCADLKRWTALMLETEDLPLVHSVSYGWQGDLEEVGCEASLVKNIDADLATLAARGITIIFSSGDSGSGWQGPDCLDSNLQLASTAIRGAVQHSFAAVSIPQCCGTANAWGVSAWSMDGSTCTFYSEVAATFAKPGATSGGDLVVPRQQKLWPNWPASSPVVTAVGATEFSGAVGSEEVAVSNFGSGGGFSDMFEAPDYQKPVVQEYLDTQKSTLPPNGSFPPGGRATPDISLLGDDYVVILNGEILRGVGGTSASAPAFAAMMSLLNAVAAADKKPPLGFLNPFLYQNQQAFTDITQGNDKVGRWSEKLEYGFDCAKGWDPVTGLGTPNFAKLLSSVLGAPEGRATERRLRQLIKPTQSTNTKGLSGRSAEVLVKLHDGYFKGPLEEVDVGFLLQAGARRVGEL